MTLTLTWSINFFHSKTVALASGSSSWSWPQQPSPWPWQSSPWPWARPSSPWPWPQPSSPWQQLWLNVTSRRFNQSAKQLIVGHTTITDNQHWLFSIATWSYALSSWRHRRTYFLISQLWNMLVKYGILIKSKRYQVSILCPKNGCTICFKMTCYTGSVKRMLEDNVLVTEQERKTSTVISTFQLNSASSPDKNTFPMMHVIKEWMTVQQIWQQFAESLHKRVTCLLNAADMHASDGIEA